MGEFLQEQGADAAFIDRVKMLISKHEVGGNEEQNLLKDCDSISFFETNAERFVTEKAAKLGKQRVKDKFDWMFERITSNEAKELARKDYEKWVGRVIDY